MKKIAILFACGMLAAASAAAVEAPTVERGEKLFHSAALGTSGKSCASCHPDGKGLMGVDAYSDGQLGEMVNFCIRDALGGKMLEPASPELQSLVMYLRGLGK